MSDAKRMYLRATGSACYDDSGITHPFEWRVDLGGFLETLCGAENVAWEHQFGWENQPLVLCFDADVSTRNYLQRFSDWLSWLHIGAREHWIYDYHEENMIITALRFMQVFKNAAGEHDDGTYVLNKSEVETMHRDFDVGNPFSYPDAEIDALCNAINTGNWKSEKKGES